jgi:steroid delta-isomerase-like uncharacterized protein
MSEENKAAVRKMYDAINAGDISALAGTMTDDFVEHEEQPGVTPNKDGVVQFFTGIVAAIDGFRMDIDTIMAEGDRVSVLATAHGKHVGEIFGVPASGKDLRVPLADFFRVQGGKVNEHWGVMDSGAMLMQMGVLQPPGA